MGRIYLNLTEEDSLGVKLFKFDQHIQNMEEKDQCKSINFIKCPQVMHLWCSCR